LLTFVKTQKIPHMHT